MQGRATRGLYELPVQIKRMEHVLNLASVSHNLWHLRLGHLHSKAVTDLVASGKIKSSCKYFSICESCIIGKHMLYLISLEKLHTHILWHLFLQIFGE